MDFKTCIHCNIAKASTPEFFRKTPKTKTGLHGSCRDCENAYKREHYAKNKDKYRQNTMRWREKNKEKYNAYVNEYKQTAGKARADAWKEENREKIKGQKKEYYQKNKEKIQQQQREYRARKAREE